MFATGIKHWCDCWLKHQVGFAMLSFYTIPSAACLSHRAIVTGGESDCRVTFVCLLTTWSAGQEKQARAVTTHPLLLWWKELEGKISFFKHQKNNFLGTMEYGIQISIDSCASVLIRSMIYASNCQSTSWSWAALLPAGDESLVLQLWHSDELRCVWALCRQWDSTPTYASRRPFIFMDSMTFIQDIHVSLRGGQMISDGNGF